MQLRFVYVSEPHNHTRSITNIMVLDGTQNTWPNCKAVFVAFLYIFCILCKWKALTKKLDSIHAATFFCCQKHTVTEKKSKNSGKFQDNFLLLLVMFTYLSVVYICKWVQNNFYCLWLHIYLSMIFVVNTCICKFECKRNLCVGTQWAADTAVSDRDGFSIEKKNLAREWQDSV